MKMSKVTKRSKNVSVKKIVLYIASIIFPQYFQYDIEYHMSNLKFIDTKKFQW